jgi:hypothetical protein
MGSITMRIDGFGVLYRKLLEEITQMQEDLFGGIGFNDEEWIKFERPAFFKDETNSIRAGFNFGELEENGMSKYHWGQTPLYQASTYLVHGGSMSRIPTLS